MAKTQQASKPQRRSDSAAKPRGAQEIKMGLPFAVTKVFWMLLKVWDSYETIIKQGGTSSSKTYSILQALILKGAEKKLRITVVGQDIPNLKVGALRDFETILASSKLVDGWFVKKIKGARYYQMFNGTIFEFKSYDDAQDAKSGKRDILFVNEANGIPYDVFCELHDRTSWKTIIDYNPSAKFWVHKHLVGTEGVIRCISNFMHNRFCPVSIIRKLVKYKVTNPFRWKVYGLGQTGQVEGVIFPKTTFIPESEFPAEMDLRLFGYGADYGFSNDPFTLVLGGMYQGKIYAKLLMYKTGMRLTEIVTKFEMLRIDPMDLIAFDDSQAKEQAELLRVEHGFNVESANRRGGSILAGIGLLQDYEKMIVDDEKGHFKVEQENYTWKKKNGEYTQVPIDKFNHAWDALRYWALEFIGTPEQEEYSDEVALI